MSSSRGFCDYVVELLSPLGGIRARRMFGGYGIYREDLMFALIAEDVLYFKCDEQARLPFQDAGSEPFVYESKGRRTVMSYWKAPDESMDSPALLLPWARLGFEAALRQANGPRPVKRPVSSPVSKPMAAKSAIAKKSSRSSAGRTKARSGQSELKRGRARPAKTLPAAKSSGKK